MRTHLIRRTSIQTAIRSSQMVAAPSMTVTRYPLASLPIGKAIEPETARYATLVLHDGTAYQGISFGAEQSVAGECVFQTGMWGRESVRDVNVPRG